MKRAERHHLKENELQRFAAGTRRLYTERPREATWVFAGVGVLAIVAIGYFFWTEHVQSRAHELLAQATTVQDSRIAVPGTTDTKGTFPTERARLQAAVLKFKAAADAYPSTDAGLFARSQEAAGQLSLGNPALAVTAYQDVVKHAGSSIYAQTAQLGLAEAQARAGQYDQAISTFRDLAQRKDGPLPVDGILMQLGRTYRDAGKRSDAQQTFNRIVQEFPDSPFSQEAKRELDSLNKA
ncbi:MAG: tetratricopeptide repeat protein [Acidobacteriota bacterium]